MQNEQEALALVQNMIQVSHMENLALVLANQVSVLEKVIEAGLSDRTKPKERSLIHKNLEQRKWELMEGLQISSNTSYLSKNDFTGPVLHLGTSSNTTNTK